ncbi:hypothetical protein D3C80_1871650 [compost metagenome]
MRIVDQPFPANGGTWFFEIDPHHHFQLTVELLAQGHQARGILFRRFGIVNGTRPNHHQQAVVIATQDVVDRLASQ